MGRHDKGQHSEGRATQQGNAWRRRRVSKGQAHVHGRKGTSANEKEKGKEEKTHQGAAASHDEARQGEGDAPGRGDT
jgi:hypothetical protein